MKTGRAGGLSVWAGAVAGLVAAALMLAAALYSVRSFAPGADVLRQEPGTVRMELAGNYDWNRAGWGVPAAGDRVIEVRGTVKSWPVTAAVNWLDRYTASDLRRVARCSGTAYRCITIKAGTVRGDAVGKISDGVITIDTKKAAGGKFRKHYRSKVTRQWLVAHELGHAHGLKHRGGRNLMNPTAGAGKLTLTSVQKRHLKGR